MVTHCGLAWPSGMVRAMQYEPFFRRSPHWQATFTARQSGFLAKLAWDRRLPSRIVRRAFPQPLAAVSQFWQRKQEKEILASASTHDLVCMVKSPGGIELYKKIRELGRPRLVIDINDAVWLPTFGWTDLPETLSLGHGVICENNYIADYVRGYNSEVFVVPDSPQVEVFDLYRNTVRRDPQQVTLGWIGTLGSVKLLAGIFEALEPLFVRHPQLRLRIIGANPSLLPKSRYLRYSCRLNFNQLQMVQEVLKFDIGLFPLLHDDDGRARGTLKALVYMSGQAAVVAENFGENPGLIKEGINGLLASSLDEWYTKVEHLVVNSEERLAMAKRGLDTVRQGFTAAHIFRRITDVFDRVVSGTS